jgi:hypothetical protein
MKPLFRSFSLVILLLTLFSSMTYSQIKVFDNGYVGVNFSSSTPSSRFVINSAGSSGWQASIYNPSISTGGALATVSETGTGTSTTKIAHYSQTYLGSSNYLMGIKSCAYSSSALSVGRTYGIYAQAGNGATGFNYSVYGYLSGTNYGAAIFGTVNGYGDVQLSDQWAGYFRGKVKSENSMWAVSFIPTSDEQFKTNIQSLDQTESIAKLQLINPVQYNLKQVEITQNNSDSTSTRKYFTESGDLFTKTRYGLIAQELQKIYPDLVHQDGEGNLGIDYMGLIPVMIKALQSQEKRIVELEAIIKKINTGETAPLLKQ